jgi:hypothetical protein
MANVFRFLLSLMLIIGISWAASDVAKGDVVGALISGMICGAAGMSIAFDLILSISYRRK